MTQFTTSIVDDVNWWFKHPENEKSTMDRGWVFMAATALLGEEKLSQAQVRNVHGYLTYLLRGWNPYTADVSRSSFKDEPIEPDVFLDFDEASKTLLDWTVPISKSIVYKFLGEFYKLSQRFGNATTTNTVGERRTLILLTMRVLSEREGLSITDNILAARACMSLYGRHRRSLSDTKYGWAKQYVVEEPLFYSTWLMQHIERMLRVRKESTEILMRDVAYMAWFACMIRTVRMLKAMNQDKFANQADEVLNHHADQLTEFIDNYPLSIEESEIDRAPDRVLSVRGIRPRKKG